MTWEEEPHLPDPVGHRKAAVVVGLVSAALLLVTLFSHGWLKRDGERYGATIHGGLLSMEICEDEVCASPSNREVSDEAGKTWAFSAFGTATLANGLLGAVFVILAAVMVMQGKFFFGRITSIAIMCGLYLNFVGPPVLALYRLVGATTGLVTGAVALTVEVLLVIKDRMPDRISPTSLALLFLFLALVSGCVFVATNPTAHTSAQAGVGWAFWAFGAAVVGSMIAVFMLARLKRARPDMVDQ